MSSLFFIFFCMCVGGEDEETLWGISCLCILILMRGKDLDATLSLLSWIVCKEVDIMPWLDLWSYCSHSCYVCLCLATCSCFLSEPSALSYAPFHFLPLSFHSESNSICHFLLGKCFLVFCLSVRLNWPDTLWFQNIFPPLIICIWVNLSNAVLPFIIFILFLQLCF